MRKSKIIIFLLLFICSQITIVHSQQRERIPFGQRIVAGGEVSLGVGSMTYIDISPYIGYRITPRLTAAVGPIYIYENYQFYNYKTSTYGGRIIAYYSIIKDLEEFIGIGLGSLLIYGENQLLSVEKVERNFPTGMLIFTDERTWIDNLLLGVGISQPIGRRGSINLFVLFDVTENIYSPYENPILRIGFSY